MKNQIKFELGDDYYIHSSSNHNQIQMEVYFGGQQIGRIGLITDQVDVTCITEFFIDECHADHLFDETQKLKDVLMKLTLKFPLLVRRPEFRFILNASSDLQTLAMKNKFDGEAVLANEILVRQHKLLPESKPYPEGIQFVRTIDQQQLPELLYLLKNNTDWQINLTEDRLDLLVRNSSCFYACTSDGKIIGFARVLTNENTFASLWDVVVEEKYREKGIGTQLMWQIFSDKSLAEVTHWVLFTDKATPKMLYKKFGFVEEGAILSRNLMHKVKLQEQQPSYLADLIKASAHLPQVLNKEQVRKFLFGLEGKRNNLATFWQSASVADETKFDDVVLRLK